MSKVRAICRWKAKIFAIPMYCVKKSNFEKIREKYVIGSLCRHNFLYSDFLNLNG